MSESSTSPTPLAPWWKDLNKYHWFVFTMASLAWLFDCLDQQLFLVARPAAMASLLKEGMDPKFYGGLATTFFVAGWAIGGLVFGAVGDRIGRAKTLAITVLIYSVCTGLSAFSFGFWDFAAYRLITGFGVGGVFGLAVALVADSLPDRARPHALGLLQALSAVGNITAAAIAILVGYIQIQAIENGTEAKTEMWRTMFIIGALPAFMVVFIQLKLKEPEKWVKARAEGKLTGVKFGSYNALLVQPKWRKNALVGMTLCISGVIGLWGIGFFSPELINDVMNKALIADKVPDALLPGWKMIWTGINMIMQNIGAFFGMIAFTWAASRFGRKPVFAVAYVCAMASTILVFRYLDDRSDIFWMIPLMGFFQLSLFAGYAIYLPELFPTSLRSTGTSFCYNVGRFIAAAGPFLQGSLTAIFAANAVTSDEKLDAFRDACTWMSLIFLLGLLILPFAPETKGRDLPEE
jgi:MFS family permease